MCASCYAQRPCPTAAAALCSCCSLQQSHPPAALRAASAPLQVQPFVRKLRAWVSCRRRELGMPPAPWDRKCPRQEQPPQAAGGGGGTGGTTAGTGTTRAARLGGPGAVHAAEVSSSAQGAYEEDGRAGKQSSAAATMAAVAVPALARPKEAGGASRGAARCQPPNLVMSTAFRYAAART